MTAYHYQCSKVRHEKTYTCKGQHARFPLVDDLFLGRTRHEGPRALLRHLTRYIADNALRPVSLAELRAAWVGAMAGPPTINYLRYIYNDRYCLP